MFFLKSYLYFLQSFKPNSIKTAKNFGLKKSEKVSKNIEIHADFRNVEK